MSEAEADAAVRDARPAARAQVFGRPVAIARVCRLGGVASKQAWAIDPDPATDIPPLLLRRLGGGFLHDHTLSLGDELAVIRAAVASRVPAPPTFGSLLKVAGRDAFLMQRMPGEGVGRRIVQRDEFGTARARLPTQMAQALASIHQIKPSAVPELPLPPLKDAVAPRIVTKLEQKLDEAPDPHPAIEVGLAWLRRHMAASGATAAAPPVLVHGDFRIGNLLVDNHGLVVVLDWEFAHWGHPLEDLAWPLVRAWRFGRDQLRLGGVGSATEFLAAYNQATGHQFTQKELAWWELAGNVRWAITCLMQAKRHLSGAEPNVELAVLGRLCSEVELEILELVTEATHAGQT